MVYVCEKCKFVAIALGILDSQPDAEECVNDTWLRTWGSFSARDSATCTDESIPL